MTFDVAYIPADVPEGANAICVVIDVLRASSTIATMFDRGCKQVWLTDTIETFIQNREMEKDQLLICAENVAGNCLEGADFSPSLFLMTNIMKDRSVVMQTTNGTVAVHTLINRGIDKIFIGCMRNAQSVMNAAVKLANLSGANICIVCAGRESGTSYTIDDVYCAAKLIECAETAANVSDITVKLNDSAKLAKMSLNYYKDTVEAFAESASGNIMRTINCEADIVECAQMNLSSSVPMLTPNLGDKFLRFTLYN